MLLSLEDIRQLHCRVIEAEHADDNFLIHLDILLGTRARVQFDYEINERGLNGISFNSAYSCLRSASATRDPPLCTSLLHYCLLSGRDARWTPGG